MFSNSVSPTILSDCLSEEEFNTTEEVSDFCIAGMSTDSACISKSVVAVFDDETDIFERSICRTDEPAFVTVEDIIFGGACQGGAETEFTVARPYSPLSAFGSVGIVTIAEFDLPGVFAEVSFAVASIISRDFEERGEFVSEVDTPDAGFLVIFVSINAVTQLIK